ASPAQPAGSLSGGNAQKLVVARALALDPPLLVAANPTRGLDFGAAAYVHQRLTSQRARGGVLLISTDLDEIMALADRIAVLYRGRIQGLLPRGAAREAVGLLMGGGEAAVHAA